MRPEKWRGVSPDDAAPRQVKRRSPPPRVAKSHSTLELNPGTRSALLRFEKAVRQNGTEYMDPNNPARQAMIRLLLRYEGKLPPDPRGRRRHS